jgi:hypothetical protein
MTVYALYLKNLLLKNTVTKALFSTIACDMGSCTVQSASSDAGWSSLAARRAHNPKVVGSNPAPATKYKKAVEPGKVQRLFNCLSEP